MSQSWATEQGNDIAALFRKRDKAMQDWFEAQQELDRLLGTKDQEKVKREDIFKGEQK